MLISVVGSVLGALVHGLLPYPPVDNIVTGGICLGTVEMCREGSVPAPALQVLFELRSAELSARAADELSKFAASRRFTTFSATLVIRGFADALGDEQSNLDLSRQRAQTVADFLVRHGVDEGVIEVVAMGEVATEPGEIRNPRNRRVDLIVTER